MRAPITAALALVWLGAAGCAPAPGERSNASSGSAGANASGGQGMAGAAGSVASGGATASGGTNSGGSAGSGGTAPTSVACMGKTRVLALGEELVANFESGDLAGWYAYADATPSGVLTELAAEGPGANGSALAGHLIGTGFSDFGGGLGFGLGCWDVSAFEGIAFWAKGSSSIDNRLNFQVAIPETHAVADGGDCTDLCFDHFSKKITLGPDWQRYAISFAELAQAGFGTPATFQPLLMALNWASAGPSFDYWIDDVVLLPKSTPTVVDWTLRPEFSGPCASANPVDVNLGNSAASFVRAAHCQAFGNEPSQSLVDERATALTTQEHVRRIDVVHQFCNDSGRNDCALSYSDPWVGQVELTTACQRKNARDLGAVFMFWSDCPDGANCGMNWANTHSLGMSSSHSLLGNDYANPGNPGFWQRELLDARWAGLQFFLLNLYGPELDDSPDPIDALSQALTAVGSDVKIALFDDTWSWGKQGNGNFWAAAPNFNDAEGAAQKIYTSKWQPFFDRVPRDSWYLAQGRPLIYFYNAGTLGPRSASAPVINRMKQLFDAHFGVVPFVAVDTAYFEDQNMPNVADSEFVWNTLANGEKSRSTLHGTTLDHFMVKWDALGRDNPGQIAGPGSGIIKGTDLLQEMLTSSQDAELAIIATWNDLGEGTGIHRNYDYYVDGAWLPPNGFMSLTRAAQCSN